MTAAYLDDCLQQTWVHLYNYAHVLLCDGGVLKSRLQDIEIKNLI